MDEKDLKRLLTEQAERIAADAEARTKRYVGALQEDFNHKLEAIQEAVQTVPEIKRTVDLTFEKVGEITVDLEVLKEVVKDHEKRLQKLEA